MINWVFKWVSFFQISRLLSSSCTCNCPPAILCFHAIIWNSFFHLTHTCDFLHTVFSRSQFYSSQLYLQLACAAISSNCFSVLHMQIAGEHCRSFTDLLLCKWYSYSRGFSSQFCRWTRLAACLDSFVCFIFNTILRWNIFHGLSNNIMDLTVKLWLISAFIFLIKNDPGGKCKWKCQICHK